tara:strand:- start:1275 stop:1568 length:294 start_codon:yes stop_codon:yes gene_type:complete
MNPMKPFASWYHGQGTKEPNHARMRLNQVPQAGDLIRYEFAPAGGIVRFGLCIQPPIHDGIGSFLINGEVWTFEDFPTCQVAWFDVVNNKKLEKQND